MDLTKRKEGLLAINILISKLSVSDLKALKAKHTRISVAKRAISVLLKY